MSVSPQPWRPTTSSVDRPPASLAPHCVRVAVVVGACLAFAAQRPARADPGVVGAADFVDGVLGGPAGRALDGEVAWAEAELAAAGVAPNPGVRVERQSGPVLDQARGSQDFFAVAVPVVVSGRLERAREAARHRQQAAVSARRAARTALARDALHAFLDIVAAEQRVAVLTAERARVAPVVAVARRRADAGEVPRAVPLRLGLAAAAWDDDLAAASAAVDVARRRAEGLVGRPLPRLSPGWPALPDVVDGADEVDDVDDPALEALRSQRAAAVIDEDVAQRRAVPDIVVGGGPSLLATGSADFAVGYLASVAVDVPLFDRGQGDVARARAARAAWDAAAEAHALERAGARRAAAARQTSARARLTVVEATRDDAEALFAAAAGDLALGAGDVVAFVDAVAAVRAAHLLRIAVAEELARATVDVGFWNDTLLPKDDR
jgi:cobalt-zinc-cadmium efflux system outer membrane protein